MRLLWVAPIEFGKMVHQVGEIGTADALRRRGWDIEFLSIDSGDEGKNFMRERGFITHTISKSKFPGLGDLTFNRAIIKRLPVLLESGNFDAILVEWAGALGVRRALKRFAKAGGTPPPFLFEDRSPPADPSLVGRMQWLHYDLSWRIAARDADSIEVLVPGLETFVRSRFGDLPPMVHCPSGVEVERFKATESELGNPIRLVYHGRLDRNRGLSRIVELGRRLVENGLEVRVRIFGRGPQSNYFEKEASRYDWLEFLGEVEFHEVAGLVAENDFGILPLPDELPWRVGSPLKLMEYSASGLCVLGTDVDGCIPYADLPWVHLSPSSDPVPDWISRIHDVVRERMRFPELRKFARQGAESKLTWDCAVEDLHQELVRMALDSPRES